LFIYFRIATFLIDVVDVVDLFIFSRIPGLIVGMLALGYQWLVLDDCWHPTRSSNGTLIPLLSSFPHGMQVVVDYVHSKGLKFGLYTSVGMVRCRSNL
jgi:hypothetical protein